MLHVLCDAIQEIGMAEQDCPDQVGVGQRGKQQTKMREADRRELPQCGCRIACKPSRGRIDGIPGGATRDLAGGAAFGCRQRGVDRLTGKRPGRFIACRRTQEGCLSLDDARETGTDFRGRGDRLEMPRVRAAQAAPRGEISLHALITVQIVLISGQKVEEGLVHLGADLAAPEGRRDGDAQRRKGIRRYGRRPHGFDCATQLAKASKVLISARLQIENGPDPIAHVQKKLTALLVDQEADEVCLQHRKSGFSELHNAAVQARPKCLLSGERKYLRQCCAKDGRQLRGEMIEYLLPLRGTDNVLLVHHDEDTPTRTVHRLQDSPLLFREWAVVAGDKDEGICLRQERFSCSCILDDGGAKAGGVDEMKATAEKLGGQLNFRSTDAPLVSRISLFGDVIGQLRDRDLHKKIRVLVIKNHLLHGSVGDGGDDGRDGDNAGGPRLKRPTTTRLNRSSASLANRVRTVSRS